MLLNMAELIGTTSSGEVQLIAGESGINKTIDFFSQLNNDNINDIKERGCFLIEKNVLAWELKQQEKLILKLKDMKCSGILIDFRDHPAGASLVDVIVDPANKYNIPVVIIKGKNISLNILLTLINGLIKKHDNLVNRTSIIYKELRKVLLMGGSIDLIAQTLYRILASPVLIQDSNGKSIIQIGNSADHKIIKDYIKVEKTKIIEEYTAVKEPLCYRLNKKYHKIICPIAAGGKIYGFLSIIESQDRKLLQTDYQAIEYTSVLIGQEMIKEKHEKIVQQKLEAEIIDSLLNHKYLSEKEIIEKATIIDWDFKKDYLVMVLRVEDVDLLSNQLDLERKIKTKKQALKRTVDWELNMLNIDKILTFKGNELIVLFYLELRTGQDIKDVALKLAKRLKNKIDLDVSIGIGGFHYGLEGIRKGYKQALAALKLVKLISMKNKVLHYDELGIFKLLSKLKDDPDLFNYYYETLGPLLQTEKKDLFETLKALFDHFGNKKKAAEQLHIHRNSLAYRIEKIEELLKIDLLNDQDLLQLYLAIKIHDLFQGQVLKS